MSFAFLSPFLNFAKYLFSSSKVKGFGNPEAVFMYEENNKILFMKSTKFSIIKRNTSECKKHIEDIYEKKPPFLLV